MATKLEMSAINNEVVLYVGDECDTEDGLLSITIADFKDFENNDSDEPNSLGFRINRYGWAVIRALADKFFDERMVSRGTHRTSS